MVKKILVVEDNADSRELLVALLQLESFTVVTAEDGNTGLSVAEKERPDLIITDINMPHLNGIEMIGLLRGRPEFRNVPILALTAYGDSAIKSALEVGANHAMTKPVHFDLLVDNVKQMLDQG